MKNKKLLLGLLVILLLSLFSQNLYAQDKNLAKVYYVSVKPGHGADFESALKKHAEWRKQAGDPWTWYVYQVVNGQNLGDFVIRSGNHTWADLDNYEDFLAKGAVDFNKNVSPHIASISNAITSVDTASVNWPSNEEEANLISVTTFHLKPGHEWAFSQVVHKFDKAIKENNRKEHYAFIWNVNGGEGSRVSLVQPYKNWAAMQEPKESFGGFVHRVFGPYESQKLWDDFNAAVSCSESVVVKMRTDLSVLPDK